MSYSGADRRPPQPPDGLVPALGGRSARLTGREPEVSGLRRSVTPPLIVHVDDEPFMRKFTAMTLAQHGYHYRGFADGDVALEFCLHTVPRLLISDVMHPGIGGLQLCQQVYKLHGSATRLMLLTACMPSDRMFEWTEDIDVAWMLKPFQMLELITNVERLISAGVPRPPDAPSLAETLRLIDWEKDDVFPPFLPAHTYPSDR